VGELLRVLTPNFPMPVAVEQTLKAPPSATLTYYWVRGPGLKKAIQS
jgi:hypothetical protein